MLKISILHSLLTVSILLNTQLLFSSDQYIEEINFTTDRNIYVSGEKIQFNAIVFQNRKFQKESLSKVLYLELITPNGYSIAKAKYPLNGWCSGTFQIPINILSGIYYIKSYTKWMRNFSPENYTYTVIKIVNPFKNDVLKGEFASEYNIEITIDSSQSMSQFINIEIPKTNFETNENVLIELNINDILQKNLVTTTISVVPDRAFANTVVHKYGNYINQNLFKPEINGISLTGKTLSSDKNPIGSKRVNLSILGNNDITTQFSDSNGVFNFGFLNYYEDKDIFISSESSDLIIDNDFCNKVINIKPYPFNINNAESKIALNIIQNLQVDSLFRNRDSISQKNPELQYPFYGTPTKTVMFENYVPLPTIEEYFAEFIKDVAIRKKNGKKYFKFFGEHYLLQALPPLVMIDFVAIDDYDQLLSLNPLNISRIDIINKPYVKGNVTYGGVISFISKKNNFAGINLPSSGVFLKFLFFHKASSPIKYHKMDENFPDTRNTLFWNINYGKLTNNLQFYTGDTPGKYCIIVKCVDNNGNEYRSYKPIDIQ